MSSRKMAGEAGIGYVPAIEGLRAVAVVSVILFHLQGSLLPGGFTGVDIFFVISGFVVTASMLGRRFETIGSLLLFFYARRLVRIMPALLVMLLAAIYATQLFVPNAWLSDAVQQTAKWAFVGASNIALARKTDTYFSPRAQFNPFVHTWSLGVEEQFYLLFPFIMYWHQRLGGARLSRRRVEWLAAGLAVASFAACGLLAAHEHRFAFYLIPARFWELGVGMLLCLTIDGWRPRLAAAGAATRAALTGGSLALLAIGFAIPETDAFPFPLALLPVAGSAGLIALACALPATPVSRVLAASLPRLIGRLSYSLYLWHWPIFVLFRWTVGLDSVGLALAALAITVLLASLSYLLVETPTRGSVRLRNLPRQAVVLGALMATAAAGFAGVMLFRLHDSLTLSRTRDAVAWYADERRPLDPKHTHCALDSGSVPFSDGTITRWAPRRCSVPEQQARLVVIGDSHAVAYAPMIRQLSADLGVPVTMYTRPNCGFLRLNRPMAQPGECRAFDDAAFRTLKATLRRGDVLFVPDLRLDRLSEEFEVLPPAAAGRAVERARADAFAEGRAVLSALTATGARVVLEAPKPIFRAPPFRCADWFDRGNPICAGGLSIPAPVLQTMRAPALASERRLAAEIPGVSVWDPFPVLCPGAVCHAIGPEGPRFFDADHVSGHGNDMLYPSFRATMAELLTPK